QNDRGVASARRAVLSVSPDEELRAAARQNVGPRARSMRALTDEYHAMDAAFFQRLFPRALLFQRSRGCQQCQYRDPARRDRYSGSLLSLSLREDRRTIYASERAKR